MENFVITIGREYGAGGRLIGESLANQLGINYYDDKLIELTAQESGFAPEAVAHCESKRTSSFLYNAYMSTKTTTLTDDIYLAQTKVIEKLAQNESCVIVSHCADYILREHKNLFRVFLYAPVENRIERSRSQYKDEVSNFESYIKKQDKKRADYYNYFTPNKWGDRKNYDIMLNTSYGIEGCVKLLKAIIENLYC